MMNILLLTTTELPLEELAEELDEGLELFRSEWTLWYQQLNNELITTLIIGLAVLLLIILFRRSLARFILKMFYRTRRKPIPEQLNVSLDYLVAPLSWLLVGGAAIAVLNIVFLPAGFTAFMMRVMQSLALTMLFVLLYQASRIVGVAAAERSDARALELSKDEVAPQETIRLTQTATRYLGTFVRAIIVVIGVVTILSIWVPDITAILAGVGIGGLVLALAAQDTAANVFASIAIMLDHPFRIGEWIETEEGSGSVEHIGLRSTRIRAADQSLITVPNSTLGSIAIVNGTTRQTRHIIRDLLIDLQTSTDALSEWIDSLRILIPTIEGVISDSTMVHLTSISETGFVIGVRYKASPNFAEMLAVQQRVNLAIMQSADQRGIRFAARPLRIHMNEVQEDMITQRADPAQPDLHSSPVESPHPDG